MNHRSLLAAMLLLGTALLGDVTASATGISTMHGDVESSDTTEHAGPGAGPRQVDFSVKAAACPTVLADSTGAVWALCTKIVGRAPEVLLLDPATGDTLASLDIPKGALLGGVYAYLDERDRLVLVGGDNQLMKLAKGQLGDAPTIAVDETYNLAGFLTPGDSVVGLVPDGAGNIWMATARGRVGFLRPGEVNREAPEIAVVELGEGERVDNSISAAGDSVAVATSHALYVLTAEGGVEWRQPYDRGSARKPGQLSWGTGATPTFFGPGGGEYVTITDNADGQENLLVYNTADGAPVCTAPLFSPPTAVRKTLPSGTVPR